MAKIPLVQSEKDAIETTLLVRDYKDFETAQKNYYALRKGDFAKKNLKTRESVSAKQIIDFLTGAEFLTVSVGTNKRGKIRFCFQKIVHLNNDNYELVEKDVLMTYDKTKETHPVNGVPVE